MKKKIIFIVVMSLVVLLVGTVGVLAFVQKDYAPELQNCPTDIKITNSESKEYYTYSTNNSPEQKKEYDKIVELFNNSMKQSILESVFSGDISNELEINVITSIPTIKTYKVEFDYKNSPMVLMQNGKEYRPSTDTSRQVKFDKIVFEISENNEYKEFNLYVIQEINNYNYYYEVTTIANTHELFEYVSDLMFV